MRLFQSIARQARSRAVRSAHSSTNTTKVYCGDEMSVTMHSTGLFINNEWVDAVSGKTFSTVDPSTGVVIAEVSQANDEDVDIAVAAARAAQPEWAGMHCRERAIYLNKIADALEARAEEFIHLESLDSGKLVKDTTSVDIPQTVALFRYFAGWADKITGKTMVTEADHLNYVVHEPLGVVGAVIPWNFPLLMLANKVAPALATGNTIVVKPAEQTPLSALLFSEIISDCEMPAGVVNIVPGFGDAGAALAEHMDVDKLSFTGSTEVGRSVSIAAAQSNLKRVTLELGGKSPSIIFPDADLDQAVRHAFSGFQFNQGQCCLAGSRVYVHESIHDEVVRRMVSRAAQISVGCPFDPESAQGPQIDDTQLHRIMGFVEAGVEEGAKLECGGQRVGSRGFMMQPTVFSGVTDDMKIATEEIFGPVGCVLPFSDEEEVVERANNSNYGLAAAVFSKNIDTCLRVAGQLQAGTVWVNQYGHVEAETPFGGYKESGYGREGSEYALDAFTQPKVVKVNLSGR